MIAYRWLCFVWLVCGASLATAASAESQAHALSWQVTASDLHPELPWRVEISADLSPELASQVGVLSVALWQGDIAATNPAPAQRLAYHTIEMVAGRQLSNGVTVFPLVRDIPSEDCYLALTYRWPGGLSEQRQSVANLVQQHHHWRQRTIKSAADMILLTMAGEQRQDATTLAALGLAFDQGLLPSNWHAVSCPLTGASFPLRLIDHPQPQGVMLLLRQASQADISQWPAPPADLLTVARRHRLAVIDLHGQDWSWRLAQWSRACAVPLSPDHPLWLQRWHQLPRLVWSDSNQAAVWRQLGHADSPLALAALYQHTLLGPTSSSVDAWQELLPFAAEQRTWRLNTELSWRSSAQFASHAPLAADMPPALQKAWQQVDQDAVAWLAQHLTAKPLATVTGAAPATLGNDWQSGYHHCYRRPWQLVIGKGDSVAANERQRALADWWQQSWHRHRRPLPPPSTALDPTRDWVIIGTPHDFPQLQAVADQFPIRWSHARVTTPQQQFARQDPFWLQLTVQDPTRPGFWITFIDGQPPTDEHWPRMPLARGPDALVLPLPFAPQARNAATSKQQSASHIQAEAWYHDWRWQPSNP